MEELTLPDGVLKNMQEDEHFSDLKLGDIREHWHWVKHGVEEVIKLNNASYKPEDVYARCIYGEANLFLNEGMFFITTITVDEFNMKKSYSLWVMWASVLHTKKQLDSYLKYFAKLAKEQGCSYLEGVSYKNLQRYLKAKDWTVSTLYRKEL